MKLRVVRPLLVGGVRLGVGDTFDLDDARAIEAIATGRAERAPEEPPPAPPGPMTTTSAPELVGAKKRAKGAPKE